MGNCISAPGTASDNIALTSNDYELVIRASKELEYLMVTCFGAQGKGLHEYTDSCARILPQDLQRKMHYLATIRNKLVHEYGFNSIPDRIKFVSSFQSAQRQLSGILAKHGRAPPPASGDFCRIQ